MYHRECTAAGGAPHSRGSALSRRNRGRAGTRRVTPRWALASGDPRRRGPTIFARPDTEHIHSQLAVIAGMLAAGAGDHMKGVPSSNPCGGMTLTTRSYSRHPGQALEGGSTGAQAPRVGVCPQPRALLRLAGAVLGRDPRRRPFTATWSRTPSGQNHPDDEMAPPAKADGQVKPARPSSRRVRHASGLERSGAQPPSRLRGRPSEQGPHGYTDDDVPGVVNAGVDA